MDLQQIKSESEKFISSKGLMINSNLPLIEDLDEASPKSAYNISARMFAMSNLIGMGYGAKRSKLKKI